MNPCACGCGELVNKTWAKGHNRRMINQGACLVDGCERDARERGRCHSHAEHFRRNGVDCGPFLDTPIARFEEKVDKGDGTGCWLWTASTSSAGRYGTFSGMPAHRWSYEHFVGPIPDGLVLDHLCKTTLCVRPDHLEPVTQTENVLRGDAPPARNARKTHCKRGHEFTPENTRDMGNGRRACRECERTVYDAAERQRRYRERKKANAA